MKDILRTDFQTRQYMMSEGFEVFYYSDTKLPTVALHSHEHYEFYFFLEGNVQIQIENRTVPLSPCDFIIIPPGIYHRPYVENGKVPYRRFILWIRKEYMDLLTELCSDFYYMIDYVNDNQTYVFSNDRISFNTIQSKLIRLLDENRNERFGKSAQLKICLNDLLMAMNRIIYNGQHPKKV